MLVEFVGYSTQIKLVTVSSSDENSIRVSRLQNADLVESVQY